MDDVTRQYLEQLRVAATAEIRWLEASRPGGFETRVEELAIAITDLDLRLSNGRPLRRPFIPRDCL